MIAVTITKPIFSAVILLVFLAGFTSSNTNSPIDCKLPKMWNGNWYQREFPENSVKIHDQSIDKYAQDPRENHGVCTKMKGDHYIFENKEENCIRCLFIRSLHPNVLTYKESGCALDNGLNELSPFDDICQLIESDQFYLFKNHYKPIDCPFRNEAFFFNYSKAGNTVCSEPPSHVDLCMDDTQLLFKYQGCHDNAHAEANIEQITCIATWTDGSQKYLAAAVELPGSESRPLDKVDELFRCYTYTEIRNTRGTLKGQIQEILGYKISISAAATCSGLNSIDSGEKSLTLYKDMMKTSNNSETFCSFPPWFTSKSWHALSHKTVFRNSTSRTDMFINSSHSIHQAAFWPIHGKLKCWKSISGLDSSDVHIVAKESVGCKVKNVCLILSQRTEFISQMKVLKQPEELTQDEFIENCLNPNVGFTFPNNIYTEFTVVSEPSDTTLNQPNIHQNHCPVVGKYSLKLFGTNGINIQSSCEFRDPLLSKPHTLNSNSLTPNLMEFISDCSNGEEQSRTTIAECIGNWTVKDEKYFLISFPKKEYDSHPLIYCFHVSNDTENGISLFGTPEDCKSSSRGPSESYLSLNLFPLESERSETGTLQTLTSGVMNINSVPIMFLLQFTIIYFYN